MIKMMTLISGIRNIYPSAAAIQIVDEQQATALAEIWPG